MLLIRKLDGQNNNKPIVYNEIGNLSKVSLLHVCRKYFEGRKVSN